MRNIKTKKKKKKKKTLVAISKYLEEEHQFYLKTWVGQKQSKLVKTSITITH